MTLEVYYRYMPVYQQANPILVSRKENVKRRTVQDLRSQFAAGATRKCHLVTAILHKLLNYLSGWLEKIGRNRHQRLARAHRTRMRRQKNQRNHRQKQTVKPEQHAQKHRSEIQATLNRAFFHGKKTAENCHFHICQFSERQMNAAFRWRSATPR